jgi:autotransporter-associated beta strand protein
MKWRTPLGRLTLLGTILGGVMLQVANSAETEIGSWPSGYGSVLLPIFWAGNHGSAWDINTTTNWTFSGVPTTYMQPLAPGDWTVFDDSSANPNVLLNITVSPLAITFSNSQAYSFSGDGLIAGPASLTTRGSGTVVISLANNTYTGGTDLGGSLYRLGAANALPNGGSLVVEPQATLDMNGYSVTAYALALQGVISNSSVNTATLTMGNNDAVVIWAGSILQSGSGGIAFSKNGSNAVPVVVRTTNYINGRSYVNGGLFILTNNGAILNTNSGAEFDVAATTGTAATMIVDGGTLSINNWISVGQNSSATGVQGMGTLILNRGLVQQLNNAVGFSIGSLGGMGSLTINGGQFLASGWLQLGEGTNGVGNVYLNGGVLRSSYITQGGYPSASTLFPSYINFNGGTLMPNTNIGNFLQGNSLLSYVIQPGGLYYDDLGATVTISATLHAGTAPGRFIKNGAGTLYFNGINNNSADVQINNGMFAGRGSLHGGLTLAAGSTLGAGTADVIGKLTAVGMLTINGNAYMRLTKNGGVATNDSVAAYGGVNFHLSGSDNQLVITNITTDGSKLHGGDVFQLFYDGGNGYSDDFTSVSWLQGPGPGLQYQWNAGNGTLSIMPTSPTALYAQNLTCGVGSLTVTFTNLSYDDITSGLWDFGDGTYSTNITSNVTVHTFNATCTGITNYVVLWVTNNPVSGNNWSVYSNSVPTVVAPLPPVASFTMHETNVASGEIIPFSNTSTCGVTWLWDFGDGQTSPLANPTHSYGAANTYQVTLTAANASGFNVSLPQSVTVTNGGASGIVTSLNVLGYINLYLTNGNNYVANQLDFDGTGTNNSIATVLSTNCPDGTVVFRLNPSSGYTDGVTFLSGVGWYSASGKTNDPTILLNPGEGFVIQALQPTNIILVGNLLQGGLNFVPAGFSLKANMYPFAGGLQTDLGFVPVLNDSVWRGNPSVPAFAKYTYSYNPITHITKWNPPEPSLNVGEGFFVETSAARWWTNYSSFGLLALNHSSSTPLIGWSPPILTGLSIRNGQCVLGISVMPGTSYEVQFSPDGHNWSTVAANRSGSVWTGSWPGGTRGFYRVAMQP